MHALLALIVLAQVSGGPQVATLDEALTALEEGADVSIPPVVGAQAIQQLSGRRELPPDLLERHLQVAVLGGVFEPLAPILGKHLAADGAALEPALKTTGALPRRHWPAVLAALGPAKSRAEVAGRLRLQTACHADDADLSRGAIVIVAGAAQPEVATALVNGLVEEEKVEAARLALDALELRAPTSDLFDALLTNARSRELPPALEAPLSHTLAAFVDRDAKLGPALAAAIRQEPTPALLGAAEALPPATWDGAVEDLVRLVTELAEAEPTASPEDLQLLVAAIDAAADLRCPQVFDLLPQLCRPKVKPPVRVAALRALGEMGSRDVVLIDLLLSYIEEPAPVGVAAYESLRALSGAQLPHRPLLWHEWRERAQLQESTPERHATRLTRERARRHAGRIRTLGS